jgi:hypothetical protein
MITMMKKSQPLSANIIQECFSNAGKYTTFQPDLSFNTSMQNSVKLNQSSSVIAG